MIDGHAPPRRGLRRDDAAVYIGLGVSKFDQLVKDGRMPAPIRIDGAVLWDRLALDTAFDALSDSAPAQSDWDRALG